MDLIILSYIVAFAITLIVLVAFFNIEKHTKKTAENTAKILTILQQGKNINDLQNDADMYEYIGEFDNAKRALRMSAYLLEAEIKNYREGFTVNNKYAKEIDELQEKLDAINKRIVTVKS